MLSEEKNIIPKTDPDIPIQHVLHVMELTGDVHSNVTTIQCLARSPIF